MADNPLPLSPPPSSKGPHANSKGEELYFVHLRRTTAPDPHPEDAEDDHNYESPRKPKKTIGEELFEVHLKRSKGLEPDYDVPASTISDNKPAAKEAEIECHYNLRSKDKKSE
ncbi:hypothetical protein ACHAWF_007665 [Thalassiosira exigua]